MEIIMWGSTKQLEAQVQSLERRIRGLEDYLNIIYLTSPRYVKREGNTDN